MITKATATVVLGAPRLFEGEGGSVGLRRNSGSSGPAEVAEECPRR